MNILHISIATFVLIIVIVVLLLVRIKEPNAEALSVKHFDDFVKGTRAGNGEVEEDLWEDYKEEPPLSLVGRNLLSEISNLTRSVGKEKGTITYFTLSFIDHDGDIVDILSYKFTGSIPQLKRMSDIVNGHIRNTSLKVSNKNIPFVPVITIK